MASIRSTTRPEPLPARIRDERESDAGAIASLIERAFLTAKHAGGNEAAIVAALRAADALSVSLVAESDGILTGHVAFSPVLIDGRDMGWFGLGPLAVAPEHRHHGTGAALVRQGLARLRAAGASGCVVLGDPDYYARFGFAPDRALVLPDVPAPYFQALRFDDAEGAGIVAYHPAFTG